MEFPQKQNSIFNPQGMSIILQYHKKKTYVTMLFFPSMSCTPFDLLIKKYFATIFIKSFTLHQINWLNISLLLSALRKPGIKNKEFSNETATILPLTVIAAGVEVIRIYNNVFDFDKPSAKAKPRKVVSQSSIFLDIITGLRKRLSSSLGLHKLSVTKINAR